MAKQFITSIIMTLALTAVACSGGGRKQAEVTPVPIKHLDFAGMQLTLADYLVNPPFTDQYPAVVATVNGVPITGKSLASIEVSAEIQRRQLLAMDDNVLLEGALPSAETRDPLEYLIDQELERQAVQRLGLLPSHEEAVTYTQQQEEQIKHPQGTVQPGSREQVLELMRLQGYPAENWASSDKLVEGYREGMGVAKLRSHICPTYAKPRTPTPLVFNSSSGCDDWLTQERKHADIVYFVRWAD